MIETPLRSTLDELWQDGMVQRFGERYETTRRWRAARHRASMGRAQASDRVELGNPIVVALRGFYRDGRALATLAPFVPVLFALEASERDARREPAPRR
jgi:hypothetical protein